MCLGRPKFFFQTRKSLFQITLSANYLSAYLLSAHLGTVFSCCAHFSVKLVSLFDLYPQFLLLLSLTLYFHPCFLCSVKKIPRPQLFWPIFYQPKDLFWVGCFKGKTILTFHSVLSGLVVCIPIVLL